MDIGQVRYELQVLPKELVCQVDKPLESVIFRFTSSHTPLFGMDDKNKFCGLLTIKKSLFSRRNGPKTLIHSCLIQPPLINKGTKVEEILGMMRGLGLYSLPVFDKKGRIRGLVSAKNILKQLIKKKVFLEIISDELPVKKVITINGNETVGRAFNLFRDKNISRLVVINRWGKIDGVVTKRDILSAYLRPSNRQRFSTKGGLKNYSFDKEKLYREKQIIRKYMSEISETVDENSKSDKLIKRLLDSKYNAIILVDKDKKPKQILSVRDVLKKTIDIIGRDDLSNVIVMNYADELGEYKKNKVKKMLTKLYYWASKKINVQMIKLMIKVAYTVKNKPDRYEIKLIMETDRDEYVGNDEDRNFLSAVNKASEQIKKQITKIN